MLAPNSFTNTFVIIPAYNEEAVIYPVIQALLPFHYQIILVDDGSQKELYPLLKSLAVYYVKHPVNLGQGAALQTGIELALEKNATYIVTFDADGQHQPEDIELLLQPLIDDRADVVLGSRFLSGAYHNMKFVRRMFIKAACYINYLFSGLLLSDAHNGLRALNRKAALEIHLYENRMAHATELLSQIKKRKLRYVEVPVRIRYTDYSQQKGQTLWNSFRIFFDLLLNKIFR